MRDKTIVILFCVLVWKDPTKRRGDPKASQRSQYIFTNFFALYACEPLSHKTIQKAQLLHILMLIARARARVHPAARLQSVWTSDPRWMGDHPRLLSRGEGQKCNIFCISCIFDLAFLHSRVFICSLAVIYIFSICFDLLLLCRYAPHRTHRWLQNAGLAEEVQNALAGGQGGLLA